MYTVPVKIPVYKIDPTEPSKATTGYTSIVCVSLSLIYCSHAGTHISDSVGNRKETPE